MTLDLSTATLRQIRQQMDVPSLNSKIRGQRDGRGFASNLNQMTELWDKANMSPKAKRLNKAPMSKIIGAIFPHDDHIYAGRVYRRMAPFIQTKTVVLIGVFHAYQRFQVRDKLVFGPYQSWTSPSGLVPISPLREQVLKVLGSESILTDARMMDYEHSLETIVYWLRYQNPSLNIVPVLIPGMSLKTLKRRAKELSAALTKCLEENQWKLGRDLSIVISADAIHYGADFRQTRFGAGSLKAYKKATQLDRTLMSKLMSERVTGKKIKKLFHSFVDPKDVDRYRWTWCGRFSIPFGLTLMRELLRDKGKKLEGHSMFYETSLSLPHLQLESPGLGVTAPAHLHHFVGYPGLLYSAV